MTQQHRQALSTAPARRANAPRLAFAGIHESRTQQQVFGRVTRQRQLRCDHQRRAAGMGLTRAASAICFGVAGQVADRGIDLRQRDADRGHVEGWQVGG